MAQSGSGIGHLRDYVSGCKFDYITVLESIKQGIGKSTMLLIWKGEFLRRRNHRAEEARAARSNARGLDL